ncbi:MAG: nitroreductase family protein [Bacteroidota bacterium]
MIKIPDVKAATTKADLHPLILNRWSPRSFSNKTFTEEQINELFEAARWAASANNEQPWAYVYALRGSEGFEKLWNCLAGGNQPWTKQAAALVVAIKRNTFANNRNTNPWADHDLGMANAQLIAQATYRDIHGHFMAGFDKDKTKTLLALGEDQEPVCFIALGYLGAAEALEEPYLTREKTPRNRNPLNKFVKKL